MSFAIENRIGTTPAGGKNVKGGRGTWESRSPDGFTERKKGDISQR